MARHRIVCDNQVPTDQPKRNAHVVEVGIGSMPQHWSSLLTLAQVLAMMDRGDTFYTVSVSTGKIARVLPVGCNVCGRRIIRSSADAVTDNNLDGLPDCSK
jgi:Protein of unknown function (DUF3892)